MDFHRRHSCNLQKFKGEALEKRKLSFRKRERTACSGKTWMRNNSGTGSGMNSFEVAKPRSGVVIDREPGLDEACSHMGQPFGCKY
mmetsp:Transcript_7220/g.14833  ORF Transcript_7220/g.14833 Transcript_7220/m.14833 type:complete len:86 (-) Transcript_7220:1149-1406(-)